MPRTIDGALNICATILHTHLQQLATLLVALRALKPRDHILRQSMKWSRLQMSHTNAHFVPISERSTLINAIQPQLQLFIPGLKSDGYPWVTKMFNNVPKKTLRLSCTFIAVVCCYCFLCLCVSITSDHSQLRTTSVCLSRISETDVSYMQLHSYASTTFKLSENW